MENSSGNRLKTFHALKIVLGEISLIIFEKAFTDFIICVSVFIGMLPSVWKVNSLFLVAVMMEHDL